MRVCHARLRAEPPPKKRLPSPYRGFAGMQEPLAAELCTPLTVRSTAAARCPANQAMMRRCRRSSVPTHVASKVVLVGGLLHVASLRGGHVQDRDRCQAQMHCCQDALFMEPAPPFLAVLSTCPVCLGSDDRKPTHSFKSLHSVCLHFARTLRS